MDAPPAMTGSTSIRRAAEDDAEADRIDPSRFLEALEDPSCRAILKSVHGEARSVRELSESCGLPSSTTYRKVEELVDAGLLDERIRLQPGGNHARTYVCCFQGAVLSVTDKGTIAIEIERSDHTEVAKTIPGSR